MYLIGQQTTSRTWVVNTTLYTRVIANFIAYSSAIKNHTSALTYCKAKQIFNIRNIRIIP